MSPSRSLAITYVGDASRVLAAQKQIDSGHTKMQGGVSRVSSMFNNAFGGVIPLSAAAAGAAVVGLAVKTITAAADEGEALNKVNVVFGRSAGVVDSFADTSARSFGISRAAALEAAGGFGSMLQTAGLAVDESAHMSTALVQLAADMASFNNQDPSEMLERLRSGLAGEAEPLRQFGVFISDARVKTEAYTSGIARAGEELTEAQKVQARYNLIMADTVKQQGDFARTADGLPNRLRTLSATFTDLAADVGQVLLPVVERALGVLAFLADNLELVVAAGLGFAALRFIPDLLLNIAIAAERLGAAGLAAKLASAASGVSSLAGTLATAAPLAVGFAAALVGLTAALATWDPLGLVDDQEELNRKFEEGTLHLHKFTSQTVLGKGPLDALGRSTEDAGTELEFLERAAEASTAAIREQGTVQDQTGREIAETTDAIREQRQATLALTDSFLGIIDSGQELADAQRELNRLERQGKEDTKGYEDAVIAALEAQIGLEGAVISYARELHEAGRSQRDIERELRQMGNQLGLTKGDVDSLINRVRELINQGEAYDGSVYSATFTGTFVNPRPQVPGLAEGGIVMRPTLALIGEAGPEAVVPLNGRGPIRTAGAAPVTVNINVGTLLGSSATELARVIRDELYRLGIRNITTGIP